MLTSVMLLSAGLYAQDNIVAAADTANNEKIITYSLKEVVVSNATNELVLGELNNKSKKGNFCASDGRIACYFENSVGESYLKSLFVKIHKVKFKTEARIIFYKRHNYIQEYYASAGETKAAYESFIPGEQIATEEIIVTLQPGQKGIVEFDISKYNVAMPADGLFVSLEGGSYFDVSGNVISNADVKLKDKTWVDFHPTTEDNYCEWSFTQGSHNYFWTNVNQRIKNDFEVTFKHKPSKSILVAPNFGLKVARN
jgi:hypothetical protein